MTPFKFDSSSKNKPTEFELFFEPLVMSFATASRVMMAQLSGESLYRRVLSGR